MDDSKNVRRVFYAPDGKTVLTVTDTGGFQLWDLATMKTIYREASGHAHDVNVALSPAADSHMLAVARENSFRFFDTKHLRDVRAITDEKYHASDVRFSPDGTTVVAERRLEGTNNDEFWLYRISDGVPLRRISSAKTTRLFALTFSPDGKILAGIGDLDQVVCFDVATGRELDILSGVRATDSPLAFSPDGTTLTTLAGEQTLHFWDRATGKDRLAIADAHQDCVRSISFVNEGRTLVSTSNDKSIRFWDLSTGRPSKVVPVAPDNSLSSLAIRADGAILASGLDRTRLNGRVRNVETGAPLHSWSLEAVEDAPSFDRITLTPDASHAVAALTDGSYRSWDLSAGVERPLMRPKLPRERGQEFDVIDSFLSPDARSLAVSSFEGTILIIDIPSGDIRFKTSAAIRDPGYTDQILHRPSLEFAPDGRSLAFVREIYRTTKLPDGRSRDLWPRESTIVWLDALTGQTRRVIAIPGRNVGHIEFSADGRLLAAVTSLRDEPRVIRIFRLLDKKEVQSIETRIPWITALAFTPDGKRLAAGLYDTSIVLWDVRKTD